MYFRDLTELWHLIWIYLLILKILHIFNLRYMTVIPYASFAVIPIKSY
jgi:hypothetical protein